MKQYPGRVLGVDYGSKRVGVAVSDPTQLIASGVGTLTNDGMLLERLSGIIRTHEIVRVIVGMPYSEDGGKGVKAVEVDRFIERLGRMVAVPIETWDESNSSVRANEVFRETGMKRKKRQQKSRVDEMAARVILQEYLDRPDLPRGKT